MEALSLEQEFMSYWSVLNTVQKESLLKVVKSFVETDRETAVIKYNQEIDEAMKRIDSGQFYTHEEVAQMFKGE